MSGSYGYGGFVIAVVEEIPPPILFGRRVVILVSELGGEWMGVVEGFCVLVMCLCVGWVCVCGGGCSVCVCVCVCVV